MPLTDKACIVTGAGRGIGQAIALRLTSAGANVIAAARTASDLEDTLAQAVAHPARCVAQLTDVTKPDQVRRLIDRAKNEFGRIDVLINNAGFAPIRPMEKMTDEVFHQVVDVNINAVFYACRAAWPELKAAGGTIINLSSLASVDPFPGFAAYGAAKAWVNLFTKALADEGRESGVRCFAIAPGAVETQMLRKAFPDFPAAKTLQPDDIAGLVELLLDDRCRYASGETVFIRK